MRRILRKKIKLSLRKSPKFSRTKNDDIIHGKNIFHSYNEYLTREQSVLGLHIKGEVCVFSKFVCRHVSALSLSHQRIDCTYVLDRNLRISFLQNKTSVPFLSSPTRFSSNLFPQTQKRFCLMIHNHKKNYTFIVLINLITSEMI